MVLQIFRNMDFAKTVNEISKIGLDQEKGQDEQLSAERVAKERKEKSLAQKRKEKIFR